MIEFNLNDTVWVQLTKIGLAEHKKQYKDLYGNVFNYEPPRTDEDGWSKWQLWQLMNAFGETMKIGLRSPLATTIRLDIDTSLEAKDGI